MHAERRTPFGIRTDSFTLPKGVEFTLEGSGSAPFKGSAATLKLNDPIVDMTG